MNAAILLNLDLNELFEVETPVLELILRGTLLYLGILFLMRILPRRTTGEMTVMDLVFVLLIAEGASNAMGNYKTVTEGFIMIGTILFWNFSVNVLSFNFAFVEKLVAHPPVQIVKNGKMLKRNMRREFLTEEELISQLREEGIEDLSKVKKACIESDGVISIIKTDDSN